MRRTCLLLMLPMLLLAAALPSGAAAAWEHDFRRCRVMKAFDGGHVTLAAGDRTLELEVYWSDDKGLQDFGNAAVSVAIDRSVFPGLMPMTNAGGAISLGATEKVLPILARGQRLSIGVAGQPSRRVDLDIGASKEAASFLRKCDIYWTNWHRRQR